MKQAKLPLLRILMAVAFIAAAAGLASCDGCKDLVNPNISSLCGS